MRPWWCTLVGYKLANLSSNHQQMNPHLANLKPNPLQLTHSVHARAWVKKSCPVGWLGPVQVDCDNKVQSILGWSHPRFSLRVQSKPPLKIWNQFDSSHCPYDLYFRLWLSRTQFRLIRIWVLVYMLHIWRCWYFSCVSLEFPSFFLKWFVDLSLFIFLKCINLIFSESRKKIKVVLITSLFVIQN